MTNDWEVLKEHIRKGRTDLAISGLLSGTKTLADQHLHNQVTALSARWNTNEKQFHLGLLSGSDYNLEKNKINQSLIVLLSELAEAGDIPQNSVSNKQKFDLWKTLGYVAVIAGILGGFAEFFNFINVVPGNNTSSLQLTVYVQDKDGKPIHELQNSGKVIVDFGNDRRAPLIGENGRTNLGEIPEKFKGSYISIALDATGYVVDNSPKKYLLDGSPVYLVVKRSSLYRSIRGIIKNRDGSELISGAMIMIDHDITTYSNGLGQFEITIPAEKSKDSYWLSVRKSGFKESTQIYHPGSTPIEIRLEK